MVVAVSSPDSSVDTRNVAYQLFRALQEQGAEAQLVLDPTISEFEHCLKKFCRRASNTGGSEPVRSESPRGPVFCPSVLSQPTLLSGEAALASPRTASYRSALSRICPSCTSFGPCLCPMACTPLLTHTHARPMPASQDSVVGFLYISGLIVEVRNSLRVATSAIVPHQIALDALRIFASPLQDRKPGGLVTVPQHSVPRIPPTPVLRPRRCAGRATSSQGTARKGCGSCRRTSRPSSSSASCVCFLPFVHRSPHHSHGVQRFRLSGPAVAPASEWRLGFHLRAPGPLLPRCSY